MTPAKKIQVNKPALTHSVKRGRPAKAPLAQKMLEKIVVNAGVGRLGQNPSFEEKGLPQVSRDLAIITGQKPQLRPSKKSIAGFKMREGQVVGLRVTLRGKRMVDFFERMIKIVLPRVHDFRGIDLDAIDKGGTLNIGFREQFVFPEINAEESPVTFSFGVNVVPRLKHRDDAIKFYREAGMPLKK